MFRKSRFRRPNELDTIYSTGVRPSEYRQHVFRQRPLEHLLRHLIRTRYGKTHAEPACVWSSWTKEMKRKNIPDFVFTTQSEQFRGRITLK